MKVEVVEPGVTLELDLTDRSAAVISIMMNQVAHEAAPTLWGWADKVSERSWEHVSATWGSCIPSTRLTNTGDHQLQFALELTGPALEFRLLRRLVGNFCGNVDTDPACSTLNRMFYDLKNKDTGVTWQSGVTVAISGLLTIGGRR